MRRKRCAGKGKKGRNGKGVLRIFLLFMIRNRKRRHVRPRNRNQSSGERKILVCLGGVVVDLHELGELRSHGSGPDFRHEPAYGRRGKRRFQIPGRCSEEIERWNERESSKRFGGYRAQLQSIFSKESHLDGVLTKNTEANKAVDSTTTRRHLGC